MDFKDFMDFLLILPTALPKVVFILNVKFKNQISK